jgi:uncharacterized protein DUF1326
MYRTILFTLAVIASLTALARAEPVRGYYVEVRTSTAAGHSGAKNGIRDARGQCAVLGWEVNHGEVGNVRLDGLTVVALLCADGDLVEPSARTRVRLVVSNKASVEQRRALVEMINRLAPEVMQHIVEITSGDINLAIYQGCSRGYARLKIGPIAINTRRMLDDDPRPISGRYFLPLSRLFYQYHAWTGDFISSGDETRAGFIPAFDQSNQPTALVGGFWVEPGPTGAVESDTVAARD